MPPITNNQGTISTFLNASLLDAINKAGSHVPSGPISRLADQKLHYKIHSYENPLSLRSTSPSPPPTPPSTPFPSPTQTLTDQHVAILVFHLLTWPQTDPDPLGIVTIGLPFAMKCLGPQMVYDATRHRVRLRADSEVRRRGVGLGLPEGYLAWLCGDREAHATNVLRIGLWELKAGEEVLRRGWEGGGGW